MSGTTQQIEWYIARDGQRHGPISDSEMRKFIELGHLRAADLVWCAKFPQWQPASTVFPTQVGSAPAPAVVPAASASTSAVQEASAKPLSQAQQPTVQHSQPSFATSLDGGDAVGATAAQAAVQAQLSDTPRAQSQRRLAAMVEDEAAWADAFRSARQLRGDVAQVGQPGGPAVGVPHSETAYRPVQQTEFQPAAPTGLDAEPPEPVRDRDRRNWVGIAAAASAVILILSGLAWITWQNRAVMAGATAIGSAIKAKVSSAPSADSYRLSPYDAPGDTKEEIDASLQRTAVWRVLKRDHPEWYAERLVDVETRRKQKIEENVISRFLADVLVTLRRRNAQTALQSSPEHLRSMARTFGDNLRQLASRDASTCYTFISFGETTPFVIELARTPAFAETLQRQLVAVFEAVGNGRATRQIHAATRRVDYDQLTKELMARGWSQNDLTTFSDPQRLQSVPSEKVCSLVQEWFATHLALADKELQVRLLAESLKPLVGG